MWVLSLVSCKQHQRHFYIISLWVLNSSLKQRTNLDFQYFISPNSVLVHYGIMLPHYLAVYSGSENIGKNQRKKFWIPLLASLEVWGKSRKKWLEMEWDKKEAMQQEKETQFRHLVRNTEVAIVNLSRVFIVMNNSRVSTVTEFVVLWYRYSPINHS